VKYKRFVNEKINKYICKLIQYKKFGMTTLELELEIKKKKLLKEIEAVNSDGLLGKLQKYVRKLVSGSSPCRFTNEELRDQVRQSETDFNNGLGIPHEEVRKKFLAE
jgi:hypothetical protein